MDVAGCVGCFCWTLKHKEIIFLPLVRAAEHRQTTYRYCALVVTKQKETRSKTMNCVDTEEMLNKIALSPYCMVPHYKVQQAFREIFDEYFLTEEPSEWTEISVKVIMMRVANRVLVATREYRETLLKRNGWW